MENKDSNILKITREAFKNNIVIAKIKEILNNENLDAEQIKNVGDVKEYKEKEKYYIEINKKDWYNNKKNVDINEEALIATNLERPVYISYYEENANFNIIPKKDKIKFESGFDYTINFKVAGEGVEYINLNIITYDETNKLAINTVKANEIAKMQISSNVKAIRLALKLEKDCFLKLKETYISIRYKKRLVDMPFYRYRELGYDKPKKLKHLKVACIFDLFTMQCFSPEVNLIVFTPDNWRAVFEFNKPHILMVESAWKGNNGTWRGKVANRGNKIEELLEIIRWCKRNNIPTVFWNKEDPVHYNFFINTAKVFDYIFTTSMECIEKYKKELSCHNVYTLPFAAQPKLHNPTELLRGRKEKICFAGSFYRNKYESRAKDTKTLIDASIHYGVDIYDRNYNLKIKDYKFPKEYERYIIGTLEGDEIVKANKGYKVVLNLNTVKHSSTMFARRVYELLASNTPVVSNYSKGIKNVFGSIVVADDKKEIIEEELNLLMTNKRYYENKRLNGLRETLSKHTYEDRMLYLCNNIGINIEKEDINILVIAINEKTEGEQANVRDMINKQSFTNSELIFIQEDNIYNSYYNLMGKIDKIDFTRYDYVTYMTSKDYYGYNYLLDLFLATKYSNSDIIGKASIYLDLEGNLILKNEDSQYLFSDYINVNSMMVKVDSIWELNNREKIDLFYSNSELSKSVILKLNKYSIDKFNYIKDYKGEYANEIEV